MSESVNLRTFALKAVACTIAGGMVGYGMAWVLGQVRVCSPVQVGLGYEYACRTLPPYIASQVAMTMLLFGAILAVILVSPQYRRLVNRMTLWVERRMEERDIREYFERWGG